MTDTLRSFTFIVPTVELNMSFGTPGHNLALYSNLNCMRVREQLHAWGAPDWILTHELVTSVTTRYEYGEGGQWAVFRKGRTPKEMGPKWEIPA